MQVTERFLKYVSFGTNSSETCDDTPSSPEQLVLGRAIAEEMAALGLENARIDEKGYVYGYLPGTGKAAELPALGLIAHMDTSPAVPGDHIRPAIISYNGGDIKLSETESIRVKDYPYLANYAGQNLIVTDGTTLLGADDKAGVAEILTACEYLLAHPEIEHRPIAVGFTPDEEIGRGADFFDVKNFPAPIAYTVDGGEIGEIEYENFNAAAARVKVHGLNIHPGSAKNKMKNATLMAVDFISRMPAAETPAHTEGYEGFYHVCDIKGDETNAVFNMIIRDHDRAKFEARKAFIANLADYMNTVYGEGSFTAEIRDSYYNMKEKIEPHMELIRGAEKAFRDADTVPKIVAIRGGTDGARLSFEGLPCPNLSTGGANFHSIHEFVSVDAMEKMVQVLINLSKPETIA